MKTKDELLALRHDFYFNRRSLTHYDSGLAFVPPDVGRALDAGCGSGGFTLPLAQQARMVIGLDRNVTLVGRARAKQIEAQIPNIAWVIGNFEHLPFADNTLEFIGSYNVLHLVNGDAALGELERCVSEGGRLVVRDAIQRPRLPEPLNSLRRVYYYIKLLPDYMRAYGLWISLQLMAHQLPTGNSELEKHRFTREEFQKLVIKHLGNTGIQEHEIGAATCWEKAK